MKTQCMFAADAKALDALFKFLHEFEGASPDPAHQPKAIRGEDNVIYVEVGYRTEEETMRLGEHMAQVGADIVEGTGVLVALAPYVVAPDRRTEALEEDAAPEQA
jgi:hypothetical protein